MTLKNIIPEKHKCYMNNVCVFIVSENTIFMYSYEGNYEKVPLNKTPILGSEISQKLAIKLRCLLKGK